MELLHVWRKVVAWGGRLSKGQSSLRHGFVMRTKAAYVSWLTPNAENLPNVVKMRVETAVLVPDLSSCTGTEDPEERGGLGIKIFRCLRF